MWLAAKGAILTAKNLRRRIRHVSWCYMCNCSGEDVDHLLLTLSSSYAPMVGGPKLLKSTMGHAKNSKGGNVHLSFQKKEEKTQGMGCSSSRCLCG